MHKFLQEKNEETMSLNMSHARSYNTDRHYAVLAIHIIQRHMGSSTTGVFDDSTLRAIYDWQGSPDRITTLAKDGKFGPKSLGCLLGEMRRGPITTYPSREPIFQFAGFGLRLGA